VALRPLAARAADRVPNDGVESHPLFLIRAENTNGVMSLAEAVVRRGQEPPRHVHHREDEYFYVLEGEMTVRVGDRSFTAAPGTVVFLPRGVPHGFTVETEQARSLAIFTPAGIEGYFDNLLQLANDPEALRARRLELHAQYGLEVVPEGHTDDRNSA
jgi:quercetin dioxygenase-like cupin family protein